MTHVKTKSALLIPQINKFVATPKPHMETRKVSKYYTNCAWKNHNVNTCGVKKKEEPTIIMIETTTQNQKAHNTGSYACHIYGLNGLKMIDYPKFAKMQKMFQRKNVLTSYGKMVVDIKTH